MRPCSGVRCPEGPHLPRSARVARRLAFARAFTGGQSLESLARQHRLTLAQAEALLRAGMRRG